MLKFKQIVPRGGMDKFGALSANGTLWETATDFDNRRPRWQQIATGDMANPIVSLSAVGERLIAVDRNGVAWRQQNDGALATRGIYEWQRLEFEVVGEPPK